MRHRGLRWLQRHGHLDDAAVHALDAPDHAGGWSVDASVTIPGWDRHGLERLVRLSTIQNLGMKDKPISAGRPGKTDTANGW